MCSGDIIQALRYSTVSGGSETGFRAAEAEALFAELVDNEDDDDDMALLLFIVDVEDMELNKTMEV